MIRGLACCLLVACCGALGCATTARPQSVRAPTPPLLRPRVACYVRVVAGAPASVHIELENRSPFAFKFRDAWLHRYQRGDEPLLQVTHKGELLRHRFRRIDIMHSAAEGTPESRPPPAVAAAASPETFAELTVDGRWTSPAYDLADLFELKEPGRYWVLYQANLSVFTSEAGGDANLRCEPAAIDLAARVASPTEE